MNDSHHHITFDTLPLDPEEAAAGFVALGSEQRLDVLRHLVRAGQHGLAVGRLKEATRLAASTLSHHIRFLAQTGLIAQEKQGRSVICRADYDRLQALAGYLTRECCADAEVTEQVPHHD